MWSKASSHALVQIHIVVLSARLEMFCHYQKRGLDQIRHRKFSTGANFLTSLHPRSEITLNYRAMVERYPFSNGVVGGLIRVVKFSLYLTERGKGKGTKKASQVLREKPQSTPTRFKT